MDASSKLAAASRDGHLALRRVERQQWLIERLSAAHGQPIRLEQLANDLRVSTRTVARDVERLRVSGVPLATRRGPGGGVLLPRHAPPGPTPLDLPEIAAVLSSLAVLGPSVTPSANSAMRKLTSALQDPAHPTSRRSATKHHRAETARRTRRGHVSALEQ